MLIAPIITAFYAFVYNYSIRLIIDAMIQKTAFGYSAVLFPIVLFFFIQFAIDAAWRISDIAEWRAVPKVKQSILSNSLNYVQHHSYIFFQTHLTGTITTKINALLLGYEKFWQEVHRGLFSKILKILVNLTSLVFINVYVGLFMACWSMLYVFVMSFYAKHLKHLAFLEAQSKYTLGGLISDNLTNITSLFSFSTRDKELKKFNKQITQDFVPRQIEYLKYNFKTSIMINGFYAVMFIFILFYMIHLKQIGLITVGGFAFVFGTVLMISEDIWRITLSIQWFTKAMGDLKSALSILQIPHENLDKKNAKPLIVKNPSIEFKNVRFAYDDKLLFQELNLDINAGEKIGLIGKSGAGKTTLIYLLLRYLQPQSGEILIDGQNIADVTQNSVRTNISIIPQETILFHRTIMENIKYGNFDVTDEDVIKAAQKAHIHEYIMALKDGYETQVGERGAKLSGGQKQRIAIARAFLKNAPILILDEATSGLDKETQELVRKSLREFMNDKKKTVIAIAHDVENLQSLDRIVILEKGKITEKHIKGT